MPVDLGIPNAILSAYIQGLNIRRQKEMDELKKEQDIRNFQEQARQFNEQLAESKKLHEANIAAQKAQTNLAFQQAKLGLASAIGKGEIPYSQVSPSAEARTALNIPSAMEEFQLTGTPPNLVPGPTTFGDITLQPGEYYPPEQRGRATLEAARPLLEATKQADLARSLVPALLRAETQKEIAAVNIQSRENIARNRYQDELIKLGLQHQYRLGEISARTGQEGSREGSKLMSTTELKDLNANLPPDKQIPFGVTKEEAAKLSIIPTPRLNDTEQAKLDALRVMRVRIAEALDLGNKTKWSEHIPIVGGIVGKGKNITGAGKAIGTAYRTRLSKLTAEEIHKFFGAAFTANERTFADPFIPSLSESGQATKSKLIDFLDEINKKIDTIQYRKPSLKFQESPSNIDALVNKHRE